MSGPHGASFWHWVAWLCHSVQTQGFEGGVTSGMDDPFLSGDSAPAVAPGWQPGRFPHVGRFQTSGQAPSRHLLVNKAYVADGTPAQQCE